MTVPTWIELTVLHNQRFNCAYDSVNPSTHSCRPTMTSPRPRVVPYWNQEDDLEEAGDSRWDGERP